MRSTEETKKETKKDCFYCGQTFEDTPKGTVDLMNHYDGCQLGPFGV